ncbi:MAG: Alanine-tRNA ligase [candidate division WS6 bacterium GW2011_GWE1_34_7]|uniref:alanine--tRNA ligase n=1 Tax=candidate division WS6 bacterium GW2011_GWE1_34_7 TaxID=1619093 RepID=A0A0G0B8C7_9BACT|nr:MAG: Alanine-tRNA ligase [candidate division WS6 bacterium GW2011_GWE1_34_7]
MKNLSYIKLREEYLNFFKAKNHAEIPSAPLVPEDDASVLFVNAGMFPLVPFLKGEKHPLGNRLTNSQRCIRTGDIDEVGDTSHCTAFDMLGNWSLNDYFKKEAIEMTVEFLVDIVQFDINRIYASVFKGEDGIPKDEISINAWKDVFKKYDIQAEVGKNQKIQEYGKEHNWWGLTTGGPCGPDSEIFFDTGKDPCGKECHINCNCGKYLEIGNNVFMEYLLENGKYSSLGRHNVDFGGGLVRYAMISQGVDSIYETDIYKPIFFKVKELSVSGNIESQRIITDHILASTWAIMDGVIPSNSMQGYILRRLIRRAMRHARKLGIEGTFTKEIGEICIEQFKQVWPKLEEKKETILRILGEEEDKFNKTLEKGLKELDRLIQNKKELTGEDIFKMYETYGLPKEVIEEILKERNIQITNIEGFENAKKIHQDKSRTSSAGLFKGGLADTSEMSTKYHTATHLLLSALRKVLGEHVYQKGSNITTERLRLDFPNGSKLTAEQIRKVEDIVNSVIKEGLDITYKEVKKEEALKLVPFAAFEEKYGETVKLYYIGDVNNPFSIEICNGPHVENTSVLGTFKILKQENVGAGVKRIKAVLE